MAITVTPPALVGFSKDRTPWIFVRDNEGYELGSAAENYIKLSGAIPEGTILTISWGENQLRLRSKASPNNTGNEFPSGLGNVDHANTLAVWLQKNYYIDRDFLVTSVTYEGVPSVKFTPRKSGIAFNFLPSAFTGGNVLNAVPGVDPVVQINHSVFVELYLVGNPEPIYNGTIALDSAGEASLDVAPLLHSHLSPELPSYILPTALRCTSSCKQYYLKYASAAGENFSIGQVFTSVTRTVLLGGFGEMNGGPVSVPDFFTGDTEESDKPLLLQERTRYVRLDEPVFLSWVNVRSLKSQIYAKVTVEFADESDAIVTNAGNFDGVAVGEKLLFGVGFAQLGLSFFTGSQVVKEYTVQLWDADNAVCEPLRYIIDYSYRENIRYFAHINSYGAVETVKTFGKQSAEWKLYKETAEQIVPYQFTPADAQYVDYNQGYQESFECATGWIPKRHLGNFLDFFISPIKQRIMQGQGYAIQVNSDSIAHGTDGDNLHGLTWEYSFARRSASLSEKELEQLSTPDSAQTVPPGVQVAGNVVIGTPSSDWSGTIDPYPISGSDNPVASSGVFARLFTKIEITDLLPKMKLVDGLGSGLDTDLWRGSTPAQMTVGKASVLATARNIILAGALAGSVSFDASADATINARINSEVNFADAQVPVGVIMEVGGTTPIVNLHSNFRGAWNSEYIGGAVRVDTRGNEIVPLFQFIYRDLDGDEHTVGSLSQEGNLRYEGILLPSGQAGSSGSVLKTTGTGNIWESVTYAELAAKPTTAEGFGITNVVKQGGNTYGAALRIRTNDAQPLILGANGIDYLTISPTGVISTWETSSTTPKWEVRGGDALINGIRVGRGGGFSSNNSIFGYQAGNILYIGSQNAIFGYQAGIAFQDSSGNTLMGYRAGYTLNPAGVSGNNTFLGFYAGLNVVSATNSIAIGASSQFVNPTLANQLTIGNWIHGNNGSISIGGAPDVGRRLKTYGKGEFTDQLVLSVADGTAPMIVTSTTLVPNLNVGKLGGYGAIDFPRKAELATISEQWSFGKLPVSSVVPTLSTHLTTKSYVDGLSFVKRGESVKTISTSNIALGGLYELNEYELIDGDRILVAGQTDPTQNGVYIASGSVWSRATDADSDAELRGYYHLILSGSLAGQRWINTNSSAITIGTTNITYGLDFGQETDPTVPDWVKSIAEIDISNWNTAFARSLDVTYGHFFMEVDGNNTLLSLVQTIPEQKGIAKPMVDIYGRVVGEQVLNISDVYQLQLWLESRVARVDRYINTMRVWDANDSIIESFPINDSWDTITGKPDHVSFDARPPRFSGLPISNIFVNTPIDIEINLAEYKSSYHTVENLFVVAVINQSHIFGLEITREGLIIKIGGSVSDLLEDSILVIVEDQHGNQTTVNIPLVAHEEPPLAACPAPIGFYTGSGDPIYDIDIYSLRFRLAGEGIYDAGCQLKTADGVNIPEQYVIIHPAEQLDPNPPYNLGTNKPKVIWPTPLTAGQSYQLEIKSLNCDSPSKVLGFTVPADPGTTPITDIMRLVSSAAGATPTVIANLTPAPAENGVFLLPTGWDLYNNRFNGVAFDCIQYLIDEFIDGFTYTLYLNPEKTVYWTTVNLPGPVTQYDYYIFGNNGQSGSSTQVRWGLNGEQPLNRPGKFRVAMRALIGGENGTVVYSKAFRFDFSEVQPILKTVWADYQKVSGSYVDQTSGEYMEGLVRKRMIDGVAHTIFYYLNDFPHANPDGTPKPFSSADYPLMVGETIGIRKIYARSSWVSTFAQLKSKMGDLWTSPDLVKKIAVFNLSLY